MNGPPQPVAAESSAPHPLSSRAATVRVYALAVALVVASGALLTVIDLDAPPIGTFQIDWWVIAVIAVVTESLAFRVEFRREQHIFTFSEIPLLVGLLLADPLALLIGRTVGGLLFLAIRERQALRKLVLNTAIFIAESVTVVAVFQPLAGDAAADEPIAWIAAALAVWATNALSHGSVALAVRWSGSVYPFATMLAFGSIVAIINTSFALAIVLLLQTNPWASVLLLGIGAFLLASYRAYASLAQRHQSLSLLYDFTRIVSAERNPDAVLEAMLSHARDLLNAERAEIWLVGDGEAVRMSVDEAGWRTEDLDRGRTALLDRWFTTDHDALVAPKSSTEPRMREMADALGAADCIVAPVTESGRIVGLVAVVDRIGEMNTFGAQDGRMFGTLASHASVALENGRLIVRLHDQARQREHEAMHDALTGLPNRVLFGERLRECVALLPARGTTAAIAIMDLDGFKDINDTLGHQSGDMVLTEIGRRIANVVDPAVLVARLGGDEFAFLMTGGIGRTEVEEQAARIIEAVGRPIQVDGLSINMGISVGVALAPTDGDDAATLMQRADVAMYAAKGRPDSISFYVADHDANTPRRLTLAHDLRHAIEDGQFHLVYQPKARLTDGMVLGVEALARWVHPTLGPISPDEFIPLAERTGVMAHLTEWAIETALAQVPVWRSHGFEWGVSVNLSMRNLIDAELVPTVERLLEASGVPHDLLTLEITETNVMTDPTRTIDILTRFGEMGIHLSVDDFGTGYSSLSYLQRLPIDEVKIDKFFVLAMSSDPNAEAIVRSILDLAKHLRLSVVAEGVEDQLTWDRLRQLGCGVAQGYLLARPMTGEDLTHWARTQTVARSIGELRLVRTAS